MAGSWTDWAESMVSKYAGPFLSGMGAGMAGEGGLAAIESEAARRRGDYGVRPGHGVTLSPEELAAFHRRRHMNPGNARALRRALRRITAFEKMARKVIHFTHPGKGVGRAKFKFHHRRK